MATCGDQLMLLVEMQIAPAKSRSVRGASHHPAYYLPQPQITKLKKIACDHKLVC